MEVVKEEDFHWTRPRSCLEPKDTQKNSASPNNAAQTQLIQSVCVYLFVTWYRIVKAKSQKTSNKHFSGQKNRKDLI